MIKNNAKIPFIYTKIIKDLKKNSFTIKTFSRNSVISQIFLNRQFEVHNGKTFIKIKITKEMLGYKLGEFVPTRKKFSFKKKSHGSKNKF